MCRLVLLLAAAALLSGARAASVNRHLKLLAEMDNHIQSNSLPALVSPSKQFLAMLKKPPVIAVHEVGSTLEITCEALGAPAPSIHWFRNDAPVYEHNQESTELINTNPSSLARISSTLVVARAGAAARYTCAAVSGARASRTATVLVNPAPSGAEVSERWRLVPLAPRILVSYKVYVDVIGSAVVLPCRARAHPRAAARWRDNNGTLVHNNPRMKVLRSGELVIAPLHWSDMGEYTCLVSNMFGDDTIKTFLYPARPSVKNG